MKLSDNFTNRYEVLGEIGQGQFGKVYHIREKKSLKREFALKLLKDSEAIKKFEEEVQILHSLKDNLNILGLYDYESEEETLYILTEYKSGGNLFEYIKANGVLSENEAIELLTQLLNALEYAHTKNIIHKDIKPENILIERVNGELKFFLADWGLSNAKNSVSNSDGFKGTILYAPPEKFKKKRYFSSDIYSLACSLYYALTKNIVYGLSEKNDFIEVMTTIVNDEVDLNYINSEKLREILKGMFDKEPQSRYYINDIREILEYGYIKSKDTRGSIDWSEELLSQVMKEVKTPNQEDIQTMENLEELENAKNELKKLNTKLQQNKIDSSNKTTQISDTKNILIYNGKFNSDITIERKTTFHETLELERKKYVDNQVSQLKPFSKTLTPKSEFETDLEFEIREIDFKQEKIKYESKRVKEINKINETFTKELTREIFNVFLGKQNISMKYNANTQTFNVNLNNLNFDIAIPRDIAQKFKESIDSFNIYFDFKSSSIIEINTEFNSKIFKVDVLPKIDNSTIKIIFPKEWENLQNKFIDSQREKYTQILNLEKEIESKKSFFSFFKDNDEVIKLEAKIEKLYFGNNPLFWIDPETGLFWQKKNIGKNLTWEKSFDYAKKLNREKFAKFDDWRVPTIKELKTLLNKSLYIRKLLFRDSGKLDMERCWSAIEKKDSSALSISFYSRYDSWFPKVYQFYVLCVRGEEMK